MNFDKNSTGFTIGFTIAMVVIVGTLLALTSLFLQPRQQKNQADKKRMDILQAIKVEAKRSDAQTAYDKHIVDSYVINHKGERVEDGPSAFEVDVRTDFRDASLGEEDKFFPIYIGEKEGKRYLIIPMAGKGLWGPVWGYVSMENDYETIFGATFDHKSETPGLGAEINQPVFQQPFSGKKIVDAQGNFEPIEVAKGGADPQDPHAVDAITGGTITSKGVEEMVNRTLQVYNRHFQQIKTAPVTAQVQEEVQ
jgi:Na+-transporting NADH:ubiquinone oxidoreductase subunit C